MRLKKLFVPVGFLLLQLYAFAQANPSREAEIEPRTDAIVAKLTLQQKIDLLGGEDNFYTHAEPTVGLPRLKMSDASVGLRGWGPATAYPATISLAASWPEHARDHHWTTAAHFALESARELLGGTIPLGTLLNVNVPNVVRDEVKGTRWTRQGRKAYRDRLDRRTDPRGGSYYWLWGSFDPSEIEEGTDLAAVRDGFVSITPLSVDRTDVRTLEERHARREAIVERTTA